jgi:hypothetical protein
MNEEERLVRLGRYPDNIKDVTRILEKYPERPKLHNKLPYGYIQKVGDPNLLVPDPAVIPLLDQALDQLDAGISLRAVVEWLNANNPNATLSHSGLVKIRKYHRPDHPTFKAKPKVKRLTRDEKKSKLRKIKIASEKRRIRAAEKRIANTEAEIGIIKDNHLEPDPSLLMELDYGSDEFKELEQEVEIVFKPNPGPQTTFFAASEQEVLYGGAAGGGKSYALIADPMRYFTNKNFRGLILRRTNDELRELIWKSQELYPQVIPGAIWREKDKEWRFPSGARLWMTYLEREDDVLRYQGQAFTYIGFDELTQYPTPHTWEYMRSRLRDASGELPLFMRATSNPGGPGHGWVKRMFIDPAPAGKAFDAQDTDGKVMLISEDDEDFPVERRGKPLFQRRFIPAKLKDNPYLAKGGQYKSNLLSLPEQLQRQLMEGDWNVADGAAFGEFRESIHVIEPFEIPNTWRRFRSCDFGYSERQASAVHWYAINPVTDQLVVYRELYVNKHTGYELARRILQLESGENISYGVLDSSVWAVRGQSGPSIAEEMIAYGCRWRPSDRTKGSRVDGKNRLHQLLRVDPFNKAPGIVFFNTCRQIIADLPVIPSDKDSDDIDPKYATDHAYDSIRYGIMSRPRGYSMFEVDQMDRPKRPYTPSDPIFGY